MDKLSSIPTKENKALMVEDFEEWIEENNIEIITNEDILKYVVGLHYEILNEGYNNIEAHVLENRIEHFLQGYFHFEIMEGYSRTLKNELEYNEKDLEYFEVAEK